MGDAPKGRTLTGWDFTMWQLSKKLREGGDLTDDNRRDLDKMVRLWRAHIRSQYHCEQCYRMQTDPDNYGMEHLDLEARPLGSNGSAFEVDGRRPAPAARPTVAKVELIDGLDPQPGMWCEVKFRETLRHTAYIVGNGKNGNLRVRKHMKWDGVMKWTGTVTVKRSDILSCGPGEDPDFDE